MFSPILNIPYIPASIPLIVTCFVFLTMINIKSHLQINANINILYISALMYKVLGMWGQGLKGMANIKTNEINSIPIIPSIKVLTIIFFCHWHTRTTADAKPKQESTIIFAPVHCTYLQKIDSLKRDFFATDTYRQLRTKIIFSDLNLQSWFLIKYKDSFLPLDLNQFLSAFICGKIGFDSLGQKLSATVCG